MNQQGRLEKKNKTLGREGCETLDTLYINKIYVKPTEDCLRALFYKFLQVFMIPKLWFFFSYFLALGEGTFYQRNERSCGKTQILFLARENFVWTWGCSAQSCHLSFLSLL